MFENIDSNTEIINRCCTRSFISQSFVGKRQFDEKAFIWIAKFIFIKKHESELFVRLLAM